MGLQEITVSHHPAGTYSSQSHLTVISLPEVKRFIIMNGQAKDSNYYCMLYHFAGTGDDEIRPLLTVQSRHTRLAHALQ
jgi:hypothetical protein